MQTAEDLKNENMMMIRFSDKPWAYAAQPVRRIFGDTTQYELVPSTKEEGSYIRIIGLVIFMPKQVISTKYLFKGNGRKLGYLKFFPEH
jgi:hypothetical protein